MADGLTPGRQRTEVGEGLAVGCLVVEVAGTVVLIPVTAGFNAASH